MTEARTRVLTWLTDFLIQAPTGVEVLHRLENGSELRRTDLDELLAATAPKQKRAPQLRDPSKRVQRRGQATSLWAATEVSPEHARLLFRRIHRILWSAPATDDELIHDLGQSWPGEFSPSGARSRRAELVEAGWVEDSGLKRPSNAGRPSIVWRLVDSKG